MKNLKYIYILAFLMFNFKSFGQLPLQYGDAVVTHSPNNQSGGVSAGNIVLRTVKSNNTSTAPLGVNWNTPAMTPAGTKQPNWNATNWIQGNLGSVFGITLDANIAPNIYVSNSQIYNGAIAGKVWRINGTSGANTLVYNFNNTSRALGNLKYQKIGVTENMYVSNWDNGNIERLNGLSGSTTTWALQAPFNPKFGLQTDNPNFLPYGLALRKLSSGNYKLYYAKIATTSPFSTNEIYSVDLNAVGDFLPATETLQVTPSIPRQMPISDIAFTEDGNSMLIGQQTWYTFGTLSAHNSMVAEFDFVTGNTWVISPNTYPSGKGGGTNCAGGVSYSSNIFHSASNQFACDTTVAFTADYIYYNDPLPYKHVYGMQFMNRGPGNTLLNSISIDQDDNIITQNDKLQLGDIEVYKNPTACNTCDCGSWKNIGLGNNANWWIGGTPPPLVPTLTFNQGASTGVLFPHYNCTGNCDATFNYHLVSATGGSTSISGTTSLDLGQTAIKKLPCGSYFINITPICGNIKCPPIRIPLVIVCPPQCLDCGGDASVDVKGTPVYKNGMISGNFTINNANPVTEVRVLVEEFRLTSTNGNENCILCKNYPKTWGSIQSASLSGITPAFSNAITIDNREAIFKNGGIITIPGDLALSLALPQTTGLDCCTLKAEICLKFVIRDVNCCEKEIIKCFSVDLK
ncbi:MAG: hypothetical protein KBH29_02295 [Lutibacter sp.]|nr:hypothetical protein [Lutibacter sp.]